MPDIQTIDVFNPLGASSGTVDRAQAATELSAVDLPLALPYDAEAWPIGAAMLQFSGTTADGRTIRKAGPDRWFRDLSVIAGEGFTSVEIPTPWLSVGEMEAAEQRELTAVLRDLGMGVCAVGLVRQSIIETGRERENIAATHAATDGAAAIGAQLVCTGLHEALSDAQRDVTWFWTMSTRRNPDDRAVWDRAVSGFRDLADHAASVDVEISIKLYGGTYLCAGESAVAFLHDIGRDNVGLNPDMGNLIRAQTPIEPWESMAVQTLPFANYWHVKNYSRMEKPEVDLYLTAPAPLASGLIDYRKAIAFAVANGFNGPFLCENYGGDGISVSAENRRYIQRILEGLSSDSCRRGSDLETGA